MRQTNPIFEPYMQTLYAYMRTLYVYTYICKAKLLKNGFKPGSSLSRAKAGNCTTNCNSPDTLSLSLLFLKSDLLDTLTYTIPHTH